MESFRELLGRRGLRVSVPRLLILETLAAQQAHVRPETLRELVNRELPAASRQTVYNTLHALRSAGLVREVVGGDGARYYELDRGPHHHFVCQVCGSITDVEPEEAAIRRLQEWSREQLPGSMVRDIAVTLRGICPREECSRQSRRGE